MSQMSQGKSILVQGRIVWTGGDIFQGALVTDYNTKQPKVDQLGDQIREWSFGLAIPKTQLDANNPDNIWSVMYSEAYSIYPNGLPSEFAMKFKDGDGNDHNGQPFAKREGYPGCIVVTCSTKIKPMFFKYDNGQNVMINEGIKCGDYVNVQLNIKAHGPVGRGKPGLYVNLYAVQLIGYGTEIINKPSGDTIFGASMPPVPQGASSTPVAPQGGAQFAPQPAQQGFSAPPMGQPTPAPQAAPVGAPVMQNTAPQAAPNYGVLPPQHQPTPQAAPMGAPAPQAAPQPAPVGNGMPMPPGFGQQG